MSAEAGNTPHVAVIFNRLGPYHLARINAARQRLDVSAVELVREGLSYSWDPVDVPSSIQRHTLFSHEHAVSKWQIWRELKTYIQGKQDQLDVVAVAGWSDAAALSGIAASWQAGVPVVLMSESAHRDHDRSPWKEWIKSRILRACGSALVGGRLHRDYVEALGVRDDRIFVGYDVVDNEHFATGAESARKRQRQLRAELALPDRYFLAVCRFIEKKNLPRLVEAYADYRIRAEDEPWHLVVVGNGPRRQRLTEKIESLGLERFVHLPGFVQYPDLPAYYALAGALVHPSTTEQWGLVVNEAMASGLPVVVSRRCGCVPDLVDHGRNGFVFDPLDVGQLADCMFTVASNDSDRTAMAAAGREIIDHWSPENFAEGLKDAVEAARATSVPRPSALDRTLLWALAHR